MEKEKQLFKDSEVIEGFRYLKWNVALKYTENCRQEVRKELIEDEIKFLKLIRNLNKQNITIENRIHGRIIELKENQTK